MPKPNKSKLEKSFCHIYYYNFFKLKVSTSGTRNELEFDLRALLAAPV